MENEQNFIFFAALISSASKILISDGKLLTCTLTFCFLSEENLKLNGTFDKNVQENEKK